VPQASIVLPLIPIGSCHIFSARYRATARLRRAGAMSGLTLCST